jgi:ethanolamine utilization protein EutQ
LLKKDAISIAHAKAIFMKKKYSIQKSPFIVPTTDGKLIEEHFGNATDGNSQVSIAHMIAPSGWSEPFQTPEFDEYTYIIKGKKQFIMQYSNPFDEQCEYIAVCLPAFSMDLVNREKV